MIRPLATFGVRLVRRFACTTTLSLNACSMSVSNDICKVIASHLKGGDVVQLIGKVGAGKTATARGIIRALVKNDDEVVQSPTFSLALSYQCSFPLQLDRVQVSHFLFACLCSDFRFVHHIYAYRQAAARAARLLSRSPPHRLRRLVKTSAILGELGPMIGAHDSVCLIEWGVDMFPHRSALHVRIDDDVSLL